MGVDVRGVSPTQMNVNINCLNAQIDEHLCLRILDIQKYTQRIPQITILINLRI